MAYLPEERILIEADLYDPGLLPASRARPTAAETALLNNVTQNEIDPLLIAPIHGDAVTWKAFLRETRQGP